MADVMLAIEWSSPRPSVALIREGRVQESCLEIPRFRTTDAVQHLETFVQHLGVDWKEIGAVRVGRGPGNVTGVRQAFAWAIGFAASGGVKLDAVSSGAAQGNRLVREGGQPVWVLGDARRGYWWGARFSAAESVVTWDLAPPEVWIEKVGTERVVSGEAGRLSERLSVESDVPQAADLCASGALGPAEAFEPYYLHPPVSSPAST